MRDFDDETPYIVIERSGRGVGPFLWGALIGAGVALLMAPRSGAQTQADIRAGVRRVRASAEETFGSARQSVTRTRDRLEDRLDSVRDRVEERTERVRDVADRARRTTGGAREEIERRLADARDAQSRSRETPEAEAPGTIEADVVVTDVSQERIEGRSDLG